MKAVLVGCGAQSAAWVSGLPAGVEIVGCVDLDPVAASARATGTSAAVGTDLSEMIRTTRPDVVFDCTVPSAHLEVTLTALASGCHVLGEKPMAETLADAQRMVAAAAAAGRIYAVSQNRRYASGIRRLRAMLAGLGPLTMINSDFFLGPHFGGFRDRMKHPLLLDMAIHTFDQARFLTGADPLAVYCRSWNPAGSWYDGAASAVCIFEMTGGVVYTYRGSWCAEGCATEWNAEWRLIGERGSAVWDGASEPRAEAVAETGGWLSTLRALEPPPVGDEAADVHPVIAEFVSCVEAGTMPETVCTDNIKSLAMVHAAIESSRCGARVEIEHD